jgi:hypothetical protein
LLELSFPETTPFFNYKGFRILQVSLTGRYQKLLGVLPFIFSAMRGENNSNNLALKQYTPCGARKSSISSIMKKIFEYFNNSFDKGV